MARETVDGRLAPRAEHHMRKRHAVDPDARVDPARRDMAELVERERSAPGEFG